MYHSRMTAVAAVATSATILGLTAISFASPQKKKAPKPAAKPNATKALALYNKGMCGACHMLKGKGGKSASDLSHVGKTHNAAWIAKYTRNPKSVDPKSKMMATPTSRVSDAELKTLSAYLATLK